MTKKSLLIIAVIIIIIGVGGSAFYTGRKYEQSKSPANRFSAEGRQRMIQESAEEGFRQTAGSARGIIMAGEVISLEEQTLTIKLPDSGSRIIFFSDSTEISKTTQGSIDDVEIGKQITVSGEQNPDGSLTARTIQLSPRFFAPRNSE